MKRKYIKLGSLLLAVLLLLSSMGVALAAQSSASMEIAPGTNTFSYTLNFDAINAAYASAQFDISISDKNTLDIDSIVFDNSILTMTSVEGGGTFDTLKSVGDVSNAVIYKAGFISTINQFADAMPVCTITFTYSGSADATVTFSNLKVVRLTGAVVNDLPETTEQAFTNDDWSRTIAVSRGTEIPPDGGNTGGGGIPGGGNSSGGGQGVLGATTIDFDDVHPGDWYYNAAQYVAAAKVIEGTAPTTFEPNTPLSRAMFATILYRLAGSPSVTGVNPFTDVQSGQWYTNAVMWAAKTGITSGYTSSTFGPNDFLTREQLVTMLYRYAAFKGYSITAGQNDALRFMTDANKISSFAGTAFKWAYASNIIHGTTPTTLSPLNTATRAEGAKMLMDFMESFVAKV